MLLGRVSVCIETCSKSTINNPFRLLELIWLFEANWTSEEPFAGLIATWNLAASVITSSVVCYRAALNRRRASAASIAAAAGHPSTKDWCVLSVNYRNMCSSSAEVVSAPSSRHSSRSNSPTSTSGNNSTSSSPTSPSSSPATSPSNSLKSGVDVCLRHHSSKSSLESRRSGQQHSPVISLESLQEQCDDNDNLVPPANTNRQQQEHSSLKRISTGVSNGIHFKCRKALGNTWSPRAIESTSTCPLTDFFNVFSFLFSLPFLLFMLYLSTFHRLLTMECACICACLSVYRYGANQKLHSFTYWFAFPQYLLVTLRDHDDFPFLKQYFWFSV